MIGQREKSPQEKYPYAFKGLRIKNIVCLVASVMLLLAMLFNLPCGYYIFLRWVVVAAALFVGLTAMGIRWPWVFIMFIILLVYCPISLSEDSEVIHLTKQAWRVADFFSISLFIAAIFDVNPRSESDYRALDHPWRELLMSKAERERITREHFEYELRALEELREHPEIEEVELNHEKERSSEIECINCKKKFIPWRKNQKFCSVSCRQKYYQNR